MKKFSFTLLSILSILSSFSQVPGLKWEKYIRTWNYSGDGAQAIFDAKRTRDNGFIIVGADTGNTSKINILNKRVIWGKPWLVKLDSNGNKAWVKHATTILTGSPYESAYLSVEESADNGYVAAGYLGAIYPNTDSGNVYIEKYNSNGTSQWKKTLGGTRNDRAYSIKSVEKNGYIITGFTMSNDGDVSGNHQVGKADVWLLRLDNSGNVMWKKCFGGANADSAYAVIQTPDKGFLIAGTSSSSNGDLTGNAGATDAWIFKTDSLGNLLWQKNYGGTGYDAFKSVVLNSNGTYTFVGYSSSPIILGNATSGQKDLWVVTTTLDGNIIWSKNFGGSFDEQAFSVKPTPDGNILISGYTESNDGVVTGNNGGADAWLLKLSPTGNLKWQKCIGTNNDEGSFAAMSLTEYDFAVAGFGKPVSAYSDFDGYFVRLGNSNTIKGTIFKDDNLNGMKDASEDFSTQQIAVKIQKQGGYQRSTITQNGHFSIDVDTGSYSTIAQINKPYFNIVPATRLSSFSSYFNTDSISFALQPIPNKKDLSISLIPLTPARPGFAVSYRILYKNEGTVAIPSGEVVLKKDSRLSLVSALPVATTAISDTFRWNYNNFEPGDTASIFVNFTVAPPPTVNNNDTLSFTAFIDPVAGDETPANDTAILKQRVIGSFDPNDKTESNAGIIQPSFISQGSSLQYVIRFQNTGSDTAFNVVVRDTLSNRVDLTTLDMVTASHPYTLSIENGNHLAWTFRNILLPDSNVNEPASHGYIVYRIRPRADVMAGETIHNTASIYFDYNLPVLTNDASTLVRANLVTLPQGLLNFQGNLQGEKVNLYWKIGATEKLLRFEIERSEEGRNYHLVGTRSISGSHISFSFTDDLSGLASPVIYYRLKLVKEDGYSYSNVLVFKKSKGGTEVLEVYPNPVSREAFVSFTSTLTGKVELQLLNSTGVIVKKEQFSVQKGKNVFPITKTGWLAPGTYSVRIVTMDGRARSTFIIVQ